MKRSNRHKALIFLTARDGQKETLAGRIGALTKQVLESLPGSDRRATGMVSRDNDFLRSSLSPLCWSAATSRSSSANHNLSAFRPTELGHVHVGRSRSSLGHAEPIRGGRTVWFPRLSRTLRINPFKKKTVPFFG